VWSARREEIFSYLISSGADVICLQEAPRGYYEDLKTNLSDAFLFSENIPNLILVKKDQFQILQEGSFYLSETPGVKSIGWDAKNERSCQWVLLEHLSDGARFFVYNTHFDHMGVRARMESAKMVAEELRTLEYPYFLLGDLNSTEENYPYKTLSSLLTDCSKAAPLTDGGTTAHSWGEKADDAGLSIDFILACPINIETKSFRILRDRWGEGNFYSDHYAVYAQTEFFY
jgi:endonuclease/exonuclease/phosphatase family metal-dependent hydrolase